jgi:hypothetical protein
MKYLLILLQTVVKMDIILHVLTKDKYLQLSINQEEAVTTKSFRHTCKNYLTF